MRHVSAIMLKKQKVKNVSCNMEQCFSRTFFLMDQQDFFRHYLIALASDASARIKRLSNYAEEAKSKKKRH